MYVNVFHNHWYIKTHKYPMGQMANNTGRDNTQSYNGWNTSMNPNHPKLELQLNLGYLKNNFSIDLVSFRLPL